MISSESGVLVCLSLPSLRCLTKTRQSSVLVCPWTGSPPFPPSLAGGVGVSGASVGGGCVRTVTVKDGVCVGAGDGAGEGVCVGAIPSPVFPTRERIDDVIPSDVLAGAGGEGVGAGGEGVGVMREGVTAGGDVPSAGEGAAGKLALMNLRLAAPISRGETSTSTPSSAPSAAFLGASCGGVTCGGAGVGGVSSCGTAWGFGGQMRAEPGLDAVLPCGATAVRVVTGEDVLPSLSFPLVTSPPRLALPLRILLYTDC